MLQRVLREPLLYFLLAGAALFAVADRFGGDDRQRIVVGESERRHLADQWQAQMGRAPTSAELDALVEQWIREEIYYREALALGLDDDDVIIRRRLAQKLTFLSEDLAAAPASEETLRRYYHQHTDRYQQPARFSFAHRYFSDERRPQAQADALAALENITGEGVPEGDPFPLQLGYLDQSLQQVARLFGREFAAALADLPTGSWQGPIASAYGWHLVKVEQQRPEHQLGFEEVVERVAADYREDQRRQANEAFYRSLRERYEIVEE